MNRYKVRSILEFIHRQGPLPTDEHGVILGKDDVLVWIGLDKVLTAEEQRHVKRELSAMMEAQKTMERLRLERPYG